MHDSIIISVTQKFIRLDGAETIRDAIVSQDPSVIGHVNVTPEKITARVNEAYDHYDEDAGGNIRGDYDPQIATYHCSLKLTNRILKLGKSYTLRDNFRQFFIKLDWVNEKACLVNVTDEEI